MIIDLSLPKTGTTSMNAALRKIGITSAHGRKRIHKEIEQAVRENKPPFTYVNSDLEAITEIRAARDHFKYIDSYGGNKYLFHSRDDKSWLRSYKNQRNEGSMAEHPSFIADKRDKQLLDMKRSYENRVREYFQGRDDFLKLDLLDAKAFKHLCLFLGQSITNQPFPRRNVSN